MGIGSTFSADAAPLWPSPHTDLREVVNALLYITTTGCPWRIVPKDFPPCSTVQRHFYEWRIGFLGAHQPSSRDGNPRVGG
jgi:transposase